MIAGEIVLKLFQHRKQVRVGIGPRAVAPCVSLLPPILPLPKKKEIAGGAHAIASGQITGEVIHICFGNALFVLLLISGIVFAPVLFFIVTSGMKELLDLRSAPAPGL